MEPFGTHYSSCIFIETIAYAVQKKYQKSQEYQSFSSFWLMEGYKPLGFVGILRETPKIFSKNSQHLVALTFLSLSLYSLFYLCNVFSIKPLITDFASKSILIPFTDPTSPEFANLLIGLMQDVRVFVGFEWIYPIIFNVISLFFSIATIIAASVTHGGEKLFFKELLLSSLKLLKRPFFTWFYMSLLSWGFVFSAVIFFQQPKAMKALVIILGILDPILYNCLDVIWTLALVVSVIEEKCGIEATKKAAQVVKGRQLHGFVLNILFTLISLILFQAMRLMTIKQSAVLSIIIQLLVQTCICLVKMFWLMAYTVFYYQCKKTHEEEVELQGRIGYSKIPSTPIFNEP